MASSPTVVADLTDEHYLDTSNFEWPLLRSEQLTEVVRTPSWLRHRTALRNLSSPSR